MNTFDQELNMINDHPVGLTITDAKITDENILILWFDDGSSIAFRLSEEQNLVDLCTICGASPMTVDCNNANCDKGQVR